MDFEITGEYIELNKLLKVADVAPTGGVAGLMIADGEIQVDGVTEYRKRCKIRSGQVVSFQDITINVL